MGYLLRSRPVLTEPTHRATPFEIFFDLVFVVALTRVTTFMGHPLTPLSLVQGFILLLLLWIGWTNYTWLSNQAWADIGLIRAGSTVAMAALILIALAIPDAWQKRAGGVPASLTLALAYIVFTALHLVLYFHAAGGDRRLRTTVILYATTTSLAWIPLILGAMLNGIAQTLLWAAAFVINYVGGFLASALSGWQLRSPGHFTQRHGLVLIIALGEALTSAVIGSGATVAHGPVIAAELFAFTTAVCLWRLYFKGAAVTAGKALARTPTERRAQVATNAYSFAHFPMIAGIVYLALGIEQVLANLVENQPHRAAGTPLEWTATGALYGGVVLYLTGQAMFLRITAGSTPSAQLVALGAVLLLMPAARVLPALAVLGLLTALLVALALHERLSVGEQAVTKDDAVAD
jgi:low temperature requirement protein LtrA